MIEKGFLKNLIKKIIVFELALKKREVETRKNR